MAKKYRVTLTTKERQELEGLISRGKGAARKLMHARVLLQVDESERGPAGKADADVASALNVNVRTIERGCDSGLSSRDSKRRLCRRAASGSIPASSTANRKRS